MTTKQRFPHHIHNCILIRRWFRRQWVCIVCNTYFPGDVTGQPSSGNAEASTPT